MVGALKRRVSTARVPTLLDASPRVRPLPPPEPLSSPYLLSSSLSACTTSFTALAMPTKEELLTQAQSSSDPKRAEALYREILGELRGITTSQRAYDSSTL